jgi:hypothetical protein
MELHPSFAAFLGQAGTAAAAPAAGEAKPAAKATKKRKAADESPDEDAATADDVVKDHEPTAATTKSDGNKSDAPKSPTKKTPAAKREKKPPAEKKAPAAKGKGHAKKQVKKEEPADEDDKVKSEENSVDGGDGLGEFAFNKNVQQWLTDCE